MVVVLASVLDLNVVVVLFAIVILNVVVVVDVVAVPCCHYSSSVLLPSPGCRLCCQPLQPYHSALSAVVVPRRPHPRCPCPQSPPPRLAVCLAPSLPQQPHPCFEIH